VGPHVKSDRDDHDERQERSPELRPVDGLRGLPKHQARE
jgi:hypothetical protein